MASPPASIPGTSRHSPNGWGIMEEEGVFWLLTPNGERFHGCGVNGVNAGDSRETVQGRPAYYLWDFYPSVDAWAATTRARLLEWGFNHLGAWSFGEEKIGLPYIANLDLGRMSKALWFDPFDPALGREVKEWAYRLTAPHRERGLRIGYFPDNEVGWWNAALFTFYLAKGWENRTKRQLWQLLYHHYEGKWQKLLDDWVPQEKMRGFAALKRAGVALKLRPGGQGIRVVNVFTYLCAQRYYQLIHAALRAADPHALIFSDRLPIYYSQDAVRAMAPYVDVVATNYNVDGPDGWVAHYFFEGLAALTGKPILVSEFFCAAMDNRSGNKNTGHLLKVTTQAERAAVVERALRNFARFPHVVGTHWFQYYDEPQGGRPDGEDYNMGLLDIYDRPYAEVVEALQRTNPFLPALHAQAPLSPPQLNGAAFTVIPRASSPVDVTDGSLTEWNKDRALMWGFAAEPPYLPFADVYLTWDPNGLYLATIGMDYMHPDHLAYEGPFPLSETYQLHLLVSFQDRADHFAIHFVPYQVPFSPGAATNERDIIALDPQLYVYPQKGPPRPLVGAAVQHLHAAAPRISCEARFPPQLFGLSRFSAGVRLQMNIVLLSHYRGQEMYWSEGTAARTFIHPEGWRSVVLR